MILIEAGERDIKSFDAKVLFASQLSKRGHAIVIDDRLEPQFLNRNRQFEAAPFLADCTQIAMSGLIVIGAEQVSDETLALLRSYDLGSEVPVCAIGRFSDQQNLIGSASRIAYAIGKEARIVDLNELQSKQILRGSTTPLVSSPNGTKKLQSKRKSLFLVLPADLLEDPIVLSRLEAMAHIQFIDLSLVTTGDGKEFVRKSQYSDLPVYGLADLTPANFASFADIAVFFGEGVAGERVASFALDLMHSSGVLIDCTSDAAFVSTGAPALRGPSDLAALPHYLENAVLPNVSEIGKQARENDWLQSTSIQHLEAALELFPPPATKAQKSKPKTIFVPTNGNGLGHAQRCLLIAESAKRKKDISFAAFPSCVGLIAGRNFPCVPLVQKSSFHAEGHAHDLVNYLRLTRQLSPGDKLVFDGGYVFDSIYRTIMENALDATWIRRGLWRAGQIKSHAFDREKAFNRVIVPQEAFDELNTAYTFGTKVHHVGPIVQDSVLDPADADALILRLKKNLGVEFSELVITMLGGGVASDRSAQLQAVCAMLESRADCLHLVVVWPGSKVSLGLYGWQNTKVVKTRNALLLCQAADLVISAAGYNSFHELLYHAVPSVFIPQSAPFLDDQEARARAGSDRDLSATVLEHEVLLLEREIGAFLEEGKGDDIRTRLSNTKFPECGNARAAVVIEKDAMK